MIVIRAWAGTRGSPPQLSFNCWTPFAWRLSIIFFMIEAISQACLTSQWSVGEVFRLSNQQEPMETDGSSVSHWSPSVTGPNKVGRGPRITFVGQFHQVHMTGWPSRNGRPVSCFYDPGNSQMRGTMPHLRSPGSWAASCCRQV